MGAASVRWAVLVHLKTRSLTVAPASPPPALSAFLEGVKLRQTLRRVEDVNEHEALPHTRETVISKCLLVEHGPGDLERGGEGIRWWSYAELRGPDKEAG